MAASAAAATSAVEVAAKTVPTKAPMAPPAIQGTHPKKPPPPTSHERGHAEPPGEGGGRSPHQRGTVGQSLPTS